LQIAEDAVVHPDHPVRRIPATRQIAVARAVGDGDYASCTSLSYKCHCSGPPTVTETVSLPFTRVNRGHHWYAERASGQSTKEIGGAEVSVKDVGTHLPNVTSYGSYC